MSVSSFGGSLPSVSLPSPVASGFTAPSDNPCEVITLVEQIDLRKAADRMAIAGANSFAAENFGSDRSFFPTSDASSARTSNRSFESLSIHTSSTGSTGRTSINSLPDAIQRPKTRPAAHVTADIRKFKEKDEKFFDDNWDNCFAAVKHKCLETDPIGYPRQLAYEELLRRWQSKHLATSRTTLPSQRPTVPVIGGASVVTKRGRLRAKPVAVCSLADPDISSMYIRGPSIHGSDRSGISSSLESIDESPELINQFENASDDVLGRKTTDDVVGDHSSLSRKGSERSMSSKRTSRTDLSPEDISPPPLSEVGTVSAVVQPQNQALRSDISGAEDVQDNRTEKENKLTIEQLKLVPKQFKVNLADCGFRSLHDPHASPIEESGIVNPEVPDGVDPATDPTRNYDPALPGATTPTCETPISPSPSLQVFDLEPASPATAESPQSRNALSDFNFGYKTAHTSEALQSPVITQTSSTAKVKEAPSDLEALKRDLEEKHRRGRGIRSRLRARLKKPDRWNLEPGPRQTMSRETLQYWWARRAARRKERRARPPELGESDFSSMSFTSSSVSGVTESESSEKEYSVGSRHESENGSESPADSSSGTSGRRDGFYNLERPRLIDLLPAEKVQSRQPRGRGRFPRFSRSRPRTGHQGLFAKFQRRKKPSRIID
jgi:hypothetical protein